MTDLREHTKEIPGPLDGMENAKPGEIVFTLQAGDPLAARLVRLWAWGARVRAGVLTVGKDTADSVLNEFIDAAAGNLAHHEKKRQELQIRATEAESISWDMDSYRRNEPSQVEEVFSEGYSGYKPGESVVEKIAESRARLEAGRILNNATGEIADVAEIAGKYGLESEAKELLAIVEKLKPLSDAVRPQRRGGPAYG